MAPTVPHRRQRRRSLSPEAEAQRREAYETGATDEEAAKRCGVTPSAFAAWRNRRGLKAKRRNPGLPPQEAQRRLRVIAGSPSVYEAARRLRMDWSNVYRWMKNHGIPIPRHWSHRSQRR